MAKEHIVIIKKENGVIASYPMKQWLRENPSFIPEGLDPTNDTSHALRRGLRRSGWMLEEKADKVLLIKPDEEGNFSFAEPILKTINQNEEEIGEKEILEAEEITFSLERDLQHALRANISQLEPGLTIIDGGNEKSTEAGKIDITARDEKGNIVVIELKAGKANPEVIAQTLSYMGSITKVEEKPVRGILVAGDFHKKVILASRAIPNLHLKKYSFQFTFCDVI
jgi:hypothetical protein